MPWQIVNNEFNKKFYVINKYTGRIIGTHNTYDKALKQLRLLYLFTNDYKRIKQRYN